MSKQPAELSMEKFIEYGFLQEINRLFLHPSGLSLQVVKDKDDDHVWNVQIIDKRDQPEDLRLTGANSTLIKKALLVNQIRSNSVQRRVEHLGYDVQPLR